MKIQIKNSYVPAIEEVEIENGYYIYNHVPNRPMLFHVSDTEVSVCELWIYDNKPSQLTDHSFDSTCFGNNETGIEYDLMKAQKTTKTEFVNKLISMRADYLNRNKRVQEVAA